MQAYASILADLGCKTDALELYRQVLAGREAKLGPKHQSVLDTVDALGELYCALGQYEEAEKYSRRAFNGLRELFKAPHPDLLMSASNLSMVLIAAAHQDGMTSHIPAEAESLAEMALEGSKQLLGPKHPTTVHMLWRMGTLKSHQKEVAEAERIFQEAHASGVDLGMPKLECFVGQQGRNAEPSPGEHQLLIPRFPLQ